ncbi:MAG: class I SAM-dependent rRNA methyltransferase [Chloroflexi bacterium]|nr:class I SAM-dependent rRNA methyltransferase [Chloroflexota bacterium]
MTPTITLKPGKEKPLLAHHPWIFSGAIARADDAHDGDTVDVRDAAGRFIARGYYNSRSQIAVRLWTWNDEPIDSAFFRKRIVNAIDLRQSLIETDATNAYRIVNAESDFLPGLIMDRYSDFVVLQFLTLGVEQRKNEIVELVQEILEPEGIYERSDVDVREKEGLQSVVGSLRGAEPTELIEIQENDSRLLVDVRRGHKTGFYLDQRENRKRVAKDLTGFIGSVGAAKPVRSPEILNVFSYSGGFSVYACAANETARVINLDASGDALTLARENMRLNGCDERGEFVDGDAFLVLRKYRDMGKSFDAIILDPPKFVHAQSQLHSGLRGYKDINLLAFKLCKPGGILATFSCSGQVSAELFQKVVFEAATDAKRDAQIIAKLSQSPDHPILLSFPESEYLKGIICHVVA